MSTLTDAARAGDPQAWAEIYTAHRRRVNSYFYTRTQNRQVAEDLTQDVFVRALRRVELFTDDGRGMGPWLMTITRNLLLDHVKRKVNREEPVGEFTPEQLPPLPSAEVEALKLNDAARLLLTMQRLPAEGQQALLLMYWQGWSAVAIGVRMSRSEGAAKQHLYRTRMELRKLLILEAAA